MLIEWACKRYPKIDISIDKLKELFDKLVKYKFRRCKKFYWNQWDGIDNNFQVMASGSSIWVTVTDYNKLINENNEIDVLYYFNKNGTKCYLNSAEYISMNGKDAYNYIAREFNDGNKLTIPKTFTVSDEEMLNMYLNFNMIKDCVPKGVIYSEEDFRNQELSNCYKADVSSCYGNKMITREEAFKEINDTQDYYVNELINLLKDPNHNSFKTINFTSPTGTGKTKMMAKLINKLSEKYYFIITTLSKGQLNYQITENLKKDCNENNFKVYGTCDYKINSKLQADDIINNIPENKECIWLRDEGHIHTNRFDEILINRCYKVINFSATNDHNDIKCNFTNTMMLRTVSQNCGTPKDAIKKLLEIKEAHKKVKNYNPCAIFRCIDSKTLLKNIIKLCKEYNLKYINITDEDFNMSNLCEDDNEYDVIINKFKLVEGIDIRRAHVLYMDNKPSNNSTTIQVIGRCRRNALLYRDDIDILDEKNVELLENTRKCYVYYNIKNMNIDKDENGELAYAFCDTISIEALKPDSIINVKEGVLPNGLKIIELENETGTFKVEVDKKTGFNVVKPKGDFYKKYTIKHKSDNNIYLLHKIPSEYGKYSYWSGWYTCINPNLINEIKSKLTLHTTTYKFDYFDDEYVEIDCKPYYDLTECINHTYTVILKEELLPILKEELIKHFKKANVIEQKELKNNKGYHYIIHNFKKDNKKINLSYYIWREKYNYNNLFTYNLTKNDLINLINHLFEDKKLKQKPALNPIIDIEDKVDAVYNQIIEEGLIFSKDKSDYIIDLSSYKFDYIRDNNRKTFTNTHNCIYCEGIIDYDNYKYDKRIIPEKIYLDQLNNSYTVYKSYTKIINDKESAIIGTDLMKNCDNYWIEDKAVTSKVKKYCKFNSFIEKKYKNQLAEVKDKLFNGKNNFNFDSKCNACLGYCVEYYSKYLIYGKQYLGDFINEAYKECNKKAKMGKYEINEYNLNDNIIVRACMLKYKELMRRSFGEKIIKVIKTISVEQLITEKYKEFVKTVVELGTKTAKFVKDNLYKDMEALNNIDPNLSINHITGLADYITEDTILDIKVTNKLTKEMAKQVLAYHYLSTKRSDLNIKRVIVYDAVSGKSIDINLNN